MTVLLGSSCSWRLLQPASNASVPLGSVLQVAGRRRSSVVRAGINIDRRRHLEESLRRQQEADARRAEEDISCPVDCVRAVADLREFDAVLKRADQEDLVVVDFYNSSCGACKYMLPLFVKLCKKGCSEECAVDNDGGAIVFVKHNVLDDYDELTVRGSSHVSLVLTCVSQDLAQFYSINTVPMFAIFKNGSLVDKFATRDKVRLEKCICRLLQQPESVNLSTEAKGQDRPPLNDL